MNDMKTKIFLLLTLAITIIGCDKDDDPTEINVDGNYIGVFERAGNTSDVELSFNIGTWTGESVTEKFPALCNGNYSISGNVITFENACPWTAEFDWTLILSDDWNYNLNGNTLVLTKANGDIYTLTKQ
jgi:hypothetical protein